MDPSPARFKPVEEESKTPAEFPVDLLCSNSPRISASGASNVMSKKVKARKVVVQGEEELLAARGSAKSPQQISVQVYHRRSKRPRHCRNRPSFFEALSWKIDPGWITPRKIDLAGDDDLMPRKKHKAQTNVELVGSSGDNGFESGFKRARLRASRHACTRLINGKQRNPNGVSSSSGPTKRWAEVIIGDADPCSLVGLACKVFWPIDELWYRGSITGFEVKSGLHKILYKDGDVENLNLIKEKIKLHVSRLEIQELKLKHNVEREATVNDEMLAMAACVNDFQAQDPGTVVWAKLTGHAMWPAIVVDESCIRDIGILKSIQGVKGICVQFFGTHDFSRIKTKNTVPFLSGTESNYHLKCKQKNFFQGLEEAKTYICKHKLPGAMLQLRKDYDCSNSENDSAKNSSSDEENQKMIKQSLPLEIGDLRVLTLGSIVHDSKYFHSRKYIFPEGYTALRKFFSMKDPASSLLYKMEVLRNPKAKSRPLFRVTLNDGGQVEGSSPDACWREIFCRIKKKMSKFSNLVIEERKFQRTGSQMFGFSNRKVSLLIKALADGSFGKKFCKISNLPAGYKPVVLGQRDLDRCDVCHIDEEYEDNLFLQCDKCRMTVHAKCYGELQPKDGSLWHCLLCRPPVPKFLPICCLCPVTGGAMKPTTDGRWAHLTCAIWIPETCLLDVKKMEPIDGLSTINKDRWKLVCSICSIPYGACIQCSSSSCRVAYHPLCARSSGLCIEPEYVDQPHLMSSDEDESQSISLLSFCRRHRQPSNKYQSISAQPCSTYVPPANPSGCARCEPYNFFGRRGQREPQVLSAASAKRSFIENRPYLVSGYRQNGFDCSPSHLEAGGKMTNLPSNSVNSIIEKYVHMRATFRKRLTFGKSRIHGFGVFAKLGHKAGDMVIEYTGETVRPLIADQREHLIYNSLVGAGTYMFRIDDDRVIDATKAGSIAQLINHSCEPNCYSRVISVDGEEHIIIFAKRDIKEWEELTYDYRFSSIDEQLACYCGFPRCRGVVNDIDSEVRMAKMWVPRSELIPWNGE